MVTLDNRLVNVGEFNGDKKSGRRNYERALQGKELVKEAKSQLEESLKRQTGFDSLNLPTKPETTTIQIGDMVFSIDSRRSTIRPSYKTAVEGMETYLNGIYLFTLQGMELQFVFPHENQIYIGTGKLLEAFNIFVWGILNTGVKHTIEYEASGKLAEEKPLDELTLREIKKYRALTEENFADYVRMDRIEPILDSYVKAYKKLLGKGQRKRERTTAVTSRSGYKTTESKAEGPDWAYVTKTLVTVPTALDSKGELNILDNVEISKAEKERMFPYYKLMYEEISDSKILTVSIQSIYKRIQTLKEEKSIEAKRLKVEPKEIV
ncbi:hypothetical protein J4480_05115 [Candidatus Woesearchaeota archaeon]|nr:hypothetical protein [Candidatus Woesearchaeota archaeon]